MMMSCYHLSILLVLLWLQPISSHDKESGKVRVALHAQVSPSQGFVVGSVITTSGLERSLNAHSNVLIAKTFYPFGYHGLHDPDSSSLSSEGQGGGGWDLVIIEGWFDMINAFIHEVRALSALHRKKTIVLFYCLDPDFPGLEIVKAFDVDGFLTNSRKAASKLSQVAPTRLLQLAADPAMLCCTEETTETYKYLRNKVLFVGSAVGMETKRMLPDFLRYAAAAAAAAAAREGETSINGPVEQIREENDGGGLVIMGKGWDEVEEFRPFWKGVLPQEDLCCAYSQAMAILGITMDGQREAGMINNRIFEALLCARPATANDDVSSSRLISDHFVELEETFGHHIRYAKVPSEVYDVMEIMMSSSQQAEATTTSVEHHQVIDGASRGNISSSKMTARELILSHHTYAQRVEEILDFVEDLKKNQGERQEGRKGMLQVAVLIESKVIQSPAFQVSLAPALNVLQSQELYSINLITLEEVIQEEHLDGAFNRYDAIWAVSGYGEPVDLFLRQSLSSPKDSQRGLVQRRALLLWGEPPSLPHGPLDGQELCRHYDVIYYQIENDRKAMEAEEGGDINHPNFQHAFGIYLGETGNSYARGENQNQSMASDEVIFVAPRGKAGFLVEDHEISLAGHGEAAASNTSSSSLRTLAVLDTEQETCPSSSSSSSSSHGRRSCSSSSNGRRRGRIREKMIGIEGPGESLTSAVAEAQSISIMGEGMELWGLVALAVAVGKQAHQDEKQRVHVWGLDDRMSDVIGGSSPETWDHLYYAQRLVAGMTRTLCLGRGPSTISMTSPTTYTVIEGLALPIEVQIDPSFKLGREGSWCLVVQGRSALCIQREGIQLVVRIRPHPTEPRILRLKAMLKSNMYADNLHTSEEVVVFVPPLKRKRQWPSFEEELSYVTIAGKTLVIHEVDVAAMLCEC